MIKIYQPAMAMNSHDVPAPWYRMENTWQVPGTAEPQHVLGWAAVVLKGFKDKYPDKWTTLVINCHGFENKKGSGGFGLKLGTGITNKSHIKQFEKIAPFVDEIIIVACKAAQNVVGISHGDELIAGIAKAAQAKVTASTATQRGGPGDPDWMPYGYIDDFEGDVLNYDKEGSIVGFRFQ